MRKQIKVLGLAIAMMAQAACTTQKEDTKKTEALTDYEVTTEAISHPTTLQEETKTETVVSTDAPQKETVVETTRTNETQEASQEDTTEKIWVLASDKSFQYQYNRQGQLIRKTKKEGSYKTVLEYDSWGNCVLELMEDAKTGEMLRRIELETDPHGNPTKSTVKRADGLEVVTDLYENEYDEQGHLIRVVQTKTESRGRIETNYDTNGNVLSRKNEMPDGEFPIFDWLVYTYDEKGCPLTLSTLKKDGQSSATDTYRYNDGGQLIYEPKTTFMVGGEQLCGYSSYEYDEKGRILWEENHKFDLVSRIKHEYDEHGNLLSKKYYNLEGKKTGEETFHWQLLSAIPKP